MSFISKLIESHVLTYQSASKLHARCDSNTPGVSKPLKLLVFDGFAQNVDNPYRFATPPTPFLGRWLSG